MNKQKRIDEVMKSILSFNRNTKNTECVDVLIDKKYISDVISKHLQDIELVSKEEMEDRRLEALEEYD